jgi:hypothetical protein
MVPDDVKAGAFVGFAADLLASDDPPELQALTHTARASKDRCMRD